VNPHLILIKFKKKPSTKELYDYFISSYVPQLVVPIKGTYDLLVYANTASFKDYVDWDRDTRRKFLIKYMMKWDQSVVVFTRLGFPKLRNELIEKTNIPTDDKAMLLILNENSRISLKKMAKMLGINYKTCIYRFNELQKKRYIRRFTISLNLPKDISLMSLFAKYVPAEEEKVQRARDYSFRMFTEDDENSLISRYLMKVSLIGSYDSFTIGAFDNSRLGRKYLVRTYKKIFGGLSVVKLEYGEISNPLLGRLPIRSMDIKKEYYYKAKIKV
jgi:DNA-binding Lrp family transcriptional regulator